MLLTSRGIGEVIAVNKVVPALLVVTILSGEQGLPLAREKLVELANHRMIELVVALTRDEVPW